MFNNKLMLYNFNNNIYIFIIFLIEHLGDNYNNMTRLKYKGTFNVWQI